MMANGTHLTYRTYEQRRLGHPETQWAGIVTMFRRAFGAASFAGFWRVWNPLFSYYLYYWCYKPLVRFVPRSVAVVLTFTVSGAVHDLCASLVTMQVFVLFAPVFAVFGLLVVVEERFGLSLSWAPAWLRAGIHAFVLVGTVGAGIVIRRIGL